MHCMHHVALECCGRGVVLRFVIKRGPKKCIDFHANALKGDGSSCYPLEYCYMQACGDGKRPGQGYFCGNGPCNMFGCNCDGGCVQGDARLNFQKFYGYGTELLPQNCG